MNRSSPGTTGFVATFVLACTFFALAAVMWRSNEQGSTAIAAQDRVASPAVSVETSTTAAANR